ncbi:MAG: glycosyltransferase family 2 protein [Candidatus Loosdrechtia sp.]|uniref:glycosyltransferase family 2 protein n=1 Tax=Candidatus Loosdrechtia sp. TaxID=3101272 RepID=UPI003A60FEC6|nr:MAG: glycosyltransferase family 2 protein [Candidatus Jettenia sp. AMX2]
MKVSIIITTYNNPSALQKVLDGILFQTVAPYEIIVADDGSGNDTAAIVKNFSAIAPFPVIHVWQEDKGFRVAKIRNLAIQRANSGYLIIMDGDCVPNKHLVYDHIALAEKGIFVQGKRIMVNKHASELFTNETASSFPQIIRLFFSHSLSNRHHLLRIPSFPALRNVKLKGIKACNMGFWKYDLIAVNGFNEDFVGWGREDSELAVRLFKYGLKKKVHPFMAICFHLWHPAHPRHTLQINDTILEKTIKDKDYFCPNGIVKK